MSAPEPRSSPSSGFISELIANLWAGVVFLAVLTWKWIVLSAIALFFLSVGVGAMYGGQYMLAAGFYFVGIALLTVRLAAEARSHERKTGVAFVVVAAGAVLFVASLWLIRYTSEGQGQPANLFSIAAVTGWDYAVALWHLPWRWILVSLAVGFVLASVINVIRNRTQPSGNKTNTQNEEVNETQTAELARLHVAANEYELIKAKYSTAIEMAAYQAAKINEFVEVVRACTHEAKLDDPLPTIRWGMLLRNNSVYRISVDGDVGPLYFEGRKLTEHKELLENQVMDLWPDRDGSISFEQRLSPSEVHLIRSSPNGKFEFDKVAIQIKGQPNAAQIHPRQLNIPAEFRAKLRRCSDLKSQAAADAVAELAETNASLVSRLNELTAHKIFLVVETELKMEGWDPYHSNIYIGERVDVAGSIEKYEKKSRIKANLYVYFDNRDPTVGRVEDVQASFIVGDEVTAMPIYSYLEGHATPIKQLEIGPTQRLGEYWLECEAAIGYSLKDLITKSARVRLVLTALRQEPYCVDISTDWEKAWYPKESFSMITVERSGAC